MSRAFVTDKEDWAYCPKAGERCMYAEEGKDCRRSSCEHYERQAVSPASDPDLPDAPGPSGRAGLRTVRRAASGASRRGSGTAESKRNAETKTERAKLSMPRRWGGRSGNNF